ncbi:hypothetical protein GQ53DRAFT_606584, partial [Thozetella sp. PMI_491]
LLAPLLPDRPATTSTALPTVAEVPSPGHTERPAVSQLRATFRSGANPQSTLRVVTPEPVDATVDSVDSTGKGVQALHRGFGSLSPQTSPRPIPGAGAGPGGGSRRQGVVFHDTFGGSYDSTSSSPPPKASSFRPRTRTMDGAFRQHTLASVETRHRVGSFSSPVTSHDDLRAVPPQAASVEVHRLQDLQPSTLTPTSKEKKSTSRSRLIKRTTSHPTSPLLSPPPSVDSLPSPIPTDDANKVLMLMKTLCGKMRGTVEYQIEPDGQWYGGLCYIEEEKGSLMFDPGDSGPFHHALIADLRGCRVLPVERADGGGQCLEITPLQPSVHLILQPTAAQELELWLAALLCWQQLRPGGNKLSPGRPGSSTPPVRPEIKQRTSSSGLKDAAIIKVGKVMLWDKGLATSPGAIIKRPSTRDLRSPQTSWRRVSCILQDNGEFKLVTENDVTVLSVIELPQLARSAIQQLDKSVLDEDHCIGVFPIYAATSTQLSIFRPVYIALDSRVLFEVWFVLLRAFTIPEIYGLDASNGDQVYELTDLKAEPTGELFRVEKTVTVRVTEAKIRSRSDIGTHDRHPKGDNDPLIGNYLAEVILDGEVRARTTTKTDTKSPFWREECEFTDLPPTLPCLSVVLKRVDGNLESLSHQIQASLGLPKTGHLTEVACGSVDILLHQLERGKDHEQWLPVNDGRQQVIGTMLVKVHHEELIVLLSSRYQPLSELLHRFTSGLTAQITEALPGQLRRVAEILLNIFQVSGKATEWLLNLVEDEIDGIGNQTTMKKPRFSRRLKSNESADSASDREQLVRDMGKSLQGEANLLFRGNSLLTQALEFHMRRLGKEYLEEVLADKIFEINEINPDCEVDPGKLQNSEDVQQHWAQLIHLTTEVWECIASSAARLPPELRHVLKYIRAVAEDRYGDFLRTVTYTSVSGFLFLRFICPAILNPKLFGLLRDHPRPRAQRTLTLVAKGLQALANLSTIGKKETWMDPMNRFLNTNRQSLKDFLDEVCYISVERTNITLPASYSTPITILGRASPVEREGFPSLPYLIDHARNFAGLVKLWVERSRGSSSEAQLFEGELLEFNTISVDLYRRANDCYTRVESARAAESASQVTTEDHMSLVDAMEHASLIDTLNVSSYNSSAIFTEREGRPPGSSGSEMDSSGAGWGSRDGRLGREHPARQFSGSSEVSSTGGTMRSLRNGKNARKFLSGFMRRNRAASPD